MKVALPVWNNHISPVFDTADTILLYEIGRDTQELLQEVLLPVNGPLMRASILKAHCIRVLICGAISRMSETALSTKGIQVIPFKCGKITKVATAYREGRLETEAFSMPGCNGKLKELESARVEGNKMHVPGSKE